MTTKKYDIVGLGVSTLDVLMSVDEFPSGEGVQRAHDSALQGGGPVATALCAAARLGARTAMIDQIGNDWRGERILAEFHEHGVETGGIRRVEGTSSLATVWVRQGDGARTIAYAPGTCGELGGEDWLREMIAEAKILHLNGRHWPACLAAAKWAKENGVKVSFDGGAGRFREELRELFPLVDVAIVSRQFGEPVDAELVVVTDGANGCRVRPRGQADFHQPAFPVPDLVDTTGCGDVFHGAFLAGLARDWPLEECARVASAAAALNATALGGRGKLGDLREVAALADQGV